MRLGRWFGQAIARVDGADVRIDGVSAPAGEAPQRTPAEVLTAAGPQARAQGGRGAASTASTAAPRAVALA
ncbi:hypothetical protein [Sorangium sp. So ce1151]|uniref:hypothetical protein n=1 Tax=Sorangium sp. So ce1151 TaxID=3133332 RepID=UPI003F601AE7